MSARPLSLAAPAVVAGLRGPEPIVDVTLRVVTPMIGGGYASGQIDPEMPVNGKSIRGQLRFWWRACNAHMYARASDLFDAEAAIWGAAARVDKPLATSFSPVQIEVNIIAQGQKLAILANGRIKTEYPPYALFPFAMPPHAVRAAESGFARENLEFQVLLYPAPDKEFLPEEISGIKLAVSAWIALGGVGSRTRRGCGALLDLGEQSDSDTGVGGFHWNRLPVSAGSHPVHTPRLKGAGLLMDDKRDHLGAWRESINALKDFRQTGGIHTPTYAVTARADLGLPITSHGTNVTGRLGRTDIERMASPVICKPYPRDRDKSVPIMLCMLAPHVYDTAPRYSHGTPPMSIRSLLIKATANRWNDKVRVF